MVSFHNVIRLQPGGHKHHPIFQVVTMLNTKRSRAGYLKRLGFLNLTFRERFMFLDLKSFGTSMNQGASLKSSVKKYVSKFIML